MVHISANKAISCVISMDNEIVCKLCGVPKSEGEFHLNRTGGREYRKRVCRVCDNKERPARARRTYKHRCKIDPSFRQKQNARSNATARRERRDPRFTAKHIVADSRRSDKRHGLSNDLDREWVKETISVGCTYCGETKLRMTLDRVDNNVGHIRVNVRAACIRCNYARRNMPYDAWLLRMREARERGMFGSWTGRGRECAMEGVVG